MLVSILIGGLAIGAVYSLVAIGFSMIYRAIGLINFAQGEMVTLGALLGFTLVRWLDLPFLLAMVLAMLGGGLASLAIEKGIYRPIRVRGLPEVNLVVATIGVAIALSNTSMLVWGPQPLSYPRGLTDVIWRISDFTVPAQHVGVFVLGLALMTGLHLFFQRTRRGKSLRAAADDPVMASLVGIDLDGAVALTAFCSGVVGAAAGVLLAPLYYASFDLGLIAFKAFAAAILGGFGSIVGAMVGGLILGEIETLGSVFVASAYTDAIAYGLILVFLLFRPQGLFRARLDVR